MYQGYMFKNITFYDVCKKSNITGFSKSISNVNVVIRRMQNVVSVWIWHFIIITTIFNFYTLTHMTMNTTQTRLSLTVLCYVLKIMCCNWNFILRQINHHETNKLHQKKGTSIPQTI